MSKNLNYNSDITKHYVRYYGWKNPFRVLKNYVEREIRANRREERCKYLTFCAVQAIDVFMLEHEKQIYRDAETQRLTNVFFCENDEESFSLINKMIGNEVQGFFGDFKEIVRQDLNEELVVTSDPFDEPSSAIEREKLRLKEVKRNLLKVFPFDIINLDMYGNFFPKSEERFSESCETYNEVLKLQKVKSKHSCNRFLMFLTVYTPLVKNEINNDALQLFLQTLNQNMGYDKFRLAFIQKFNLQSPNDLEFFMQFVLGFIKQIIFKQSYSLGWQPTLKDVYCYDRNNKAGDKPYKMSTFVVEYKRNDELANVDFAGAIPNVVEADYLNQLEDIIINKPHNVPIEENIPNEVKNDLEAIVKFRNEFLKLIGIYDENKFN